MLRYEKQIHKYSQQMREKSEWFSTRICLELGVNIMCSAEQSSSRILPLFLVYWSPQPLNIHP